MNVSKRSEKQLSPKRAAILQAATEEFLSFGFSGTSMDRIAEAASVSKRTVYDHFSSKDTLFEAIVDEVLDRVEQMPSLQYSADRSLDEQLLAIGNAFATTITAKEFIKVSKVVVACFLQSPLWTQSTTRAFNRVRRDITRFLEAGKKDGRLRIGAPDTAAAQFCGLIKEVAFWPSLMGQNSVTSRERKAAVQSAVEVFLNHYEINEPRIAEELPGVLPREMR